MSDFLDLPAGLPQPADDGASAHLKGRALPPVRLPATSGAVVDLADLGAGRTVIYCYPRTGLPGQPAPDGWDLIPGARGCTPQACGFRDYQAELAALGARLYGLSCQDSAYQREVVARLHLPFEVLSDADFALTDALGLPTFETSGMRLIKRLTLIVRVARIEHLFYPVFPPDRNAEGVRDWLAANPL